MLTVSSKTHTDSCYSCHMVTLLLSRFTCCNDCVAPLPLTCCSSSLCRLSARVYVVSNLRDSGTQTILKYTVTMFLVDISPSMKRLRTVHSHPHIEGEERHIEMTNLEWALQFVKMKIQEMVRGQIFQTSHRLTVSRSSMVEKRNNVVS